MVMMNEIMEPAPRATSASEEAGGGGSDPREEVLYEMIVAAVLSRQLRAGERLNEQMLSEAHGISRTRVRRVLVRLQHAGIVRFERNRGAFICRPSVREALDLLDVRRYLEECAIRAAVARLHEGSGALTAADDGEDVSMRIARASGNQVLIRLIGDILRQCALLQAAYGTQAPPQPGEQNGMIERIRSGDARGAIDLLHRRLHALVAALDLAEAEEAPDIYARPR